MIETTKGNLLNAPVDALVNTVNTAGVMGKGIALQFKQAYPQMFRAYEQACKAGEVQLGRMHVFDLGGLVGGPVQERAVSGRTIESGDDSTGGALGCRNGGGGLPSRIRSG